MLVEPGWRGRSAASAMKSAASSRARSRNVRPFAAVATVASPITPER